MTLVCPPEARIFAESGRWGVPAVGVHHMEGHLLAPMLEEQPPEFPFVALLVSGGHTQLVRVDGIGQYELLGETLDDAAGEAFDKVAKLLGVGFPGGPRIEERARGRDPGAVRFKRTMLDPGSLDVGGRFELPASALVVQSVK